MKNAELNIFIKKNLYLQLFQSRETFPNVSLLMGMWIESFTCIVFFLNVSSVTDSKVKIIDGDHLTCLFSLALKFLISKLSETLQEKFMQEIKIGIVCTAYSNGAFMNYVRDILHFEIAMAKTGVKYLHRKAHEYDLSIYFESNGHGTLTFKESVKSKIEKLNSFSMSSKDSQTLEFINIFISMFNKTVGDSLSAMICTESALKLLDMTVDDLYEIYKELASINVKVKVGNKHAFKTNEDETRLTEPIIIQSAIDEIVQKYKGSRCFVRPSGTEDIVRIYAESTTESEAVEIAELIKKAILASNI